MTAQHGAAGHHASHSTRKPTATLTAGQDAPAFGVQEGVTHPPELSTSWLPSSEYHPKWPRTQQAMPWTGALIYIPESGSFRESDLYGKIIIEVNGCDVKDFYVLLTQFGNY